MRGVRLGQVRRWGWLALAAVGGGGLVAWGPMTGKPPASDPTRPTSAATAPAPAPAEVRWLEERSILDQAGRQARRVSGRGTQWQHPYGAPQPRALVRRASVWVLDWPGSVIPKPGHSVLATWADPQLWDAFHDIGIQLLHTGPVNRAGGLVGRQYTPSLDGWFDPIALEIDPQLGTEAEYRRMVQAAAKYRGPIAGDLVPLHTGTGADFRLAQMAYKDYPGMYTMVQIRPEDWPLLPKVDDAWASAPVPKDVAEQLTKKGYLPGLIHNNDAVKNARGLSGWAASGAVVGVDGQTRRWVYLHHFKPGQPTLNWLDPSCAGPRAVFGDLTRTVHDLGARVVRLDAVPFLGIEPDPGRALSQHYQHPLAVTSTNELAFLARKLGGWTFHELNVPLVELKKFTQNGPDLSYDFFTRAQCLHALLTGDATPLRQAFGFLREAGVDPGSLVHDLQNHDEITYQLVELDHRKDEVFSVNGAKVTGRQLRDKLLREMRAKAAGEAAPHNKLYRPEQDGVATTFAAFVAAGLDVRDPYHATPDQVAQVKQGHLLLALANAMQPGVFSLSSWDLVGALPLAEKAVAERTTDGDYRWINRGGVDLLGANPDAATSAYGLPRAQALYGPLPQQLRDAHSFVSQIKRLFTARQAYRIAEAELVAVPEPKHPAVCLLVLRLPDESWAVTALNFGRAAVGEELDLAGMLRLPAEKIRGSKVTDALTGKDESPVPVSGRLAVKLAPLTGRLVVIQGAMP